MVVPAAAVLIVAITDGSANSTLELKSALFASVALIKLNRVAFTSSSVGVVVKGAIFGCTAVFLVKKIDSGNFVYLTSMV